MAKQKAEDLITELKTATEDVLGTRNLDGTYTDGSNFGDEYGKGFLRASRFALEEVCDIAQALHNASTKPPILDLENDDCLTLNGCKTFPEYIKHLQDEYAAARTSKELGSVHDLYGDSGKPIDLASRLLTYELFPNSIGKMDASTVQDSFTQAVNGDEKLASLLLDTQVSTYKDGMVGYAESTVLQLLTGQFSATPLPYDAEEEENTYRKLNLYARIPSEENIQLLADLKEVRTDRKFFHQFVLSYQTLQQEKHCAKEKKAEILIPAEAEAVGDVRSTIKNGSSVGDKKKFLDEKGLPPDSTIEYAANTNAGRKGYGTSTIGTKYLKATGDANPLDEQQDVGVQIPIPPTTFSTAPALLQKAMQKAGDSANQQDAALKSGTTACAAIISDEGITIGTVGDSSIRIGYYNTASNAWEVTTLTPPPHRATNPGEYARILKNGGHIEAKEFGKEKVSIGTVNEAESSRSFGDKHAKDLKSPVFSTEADILQITFAALPNIDLTKAIYCIGQCDGGDVLSDKQCATILTDALDPKHKHNPAERFKNAAFGVGSNDNITFEVAELPPLNSKVKHKEDLLMMICDGHGKQGGKHGRSLAQLAVAETTIQTAIQADEKLYAEIADHFLNHTKKPEQLEILEKRLGSAGTPVKKEELENEAKAAIKIATDHALEPVVAELRHNNLTADPKGIYTGIGAEGKWTEKGFLIEEKFKDSTAKDINAGDVITHVMVGKTEVALTQEGLTAYAATIKEATPPKTEAEFETLALGLIRGSGQPGEQVTLKLDSGKNQTLDRKVYSTATKGAHKFEMAHLAELAKAPAGKFNVASVEGKFAEKLLAATKKGGWDRAGGA